jgi:hypothetical protein
VSRESELFSQYCKRYQQNTTLQSDFFDTEWLKKRGITTVEINMMLSLL